MGSHSRLSSVICMEDKTTSIFCLSRTLQVVHAILTKGGKPVA